MSCKLAEQAYELVSKHLEEYGSSPSRSQLDSLREYLDILEKMIYEEIPPKAYLIPLDPGYGKTLATTDMIKVLLDCHDLNSVGTLYVAERREELSEVFKKINRPDEVGILTTISDDYEYPDEAIHKGNDALDARVLLTTKAMIEKRITRDSTGCPKILEFDGRPRRLRIWDEAFLPARPITLSRPALQRLVGQLKVKVPALYETLDTLIDTMKKAEGDQIITMPDITEHFSLNEVVECTADTPGLNNTVADLWAISSRSVRLLKDRYCGVTLVSHEEVLPTHLLPIVVLDASSRIRAIYKIQDKHRTNMEMATLRSYRPKQYDDLTIRLARRSSSKSAWAAADNATVLTRECGNVIAADPERKWLVVHHKAVDIENQILKARPELADLDIECLGFGQHTATNRFSDRDGVIIAGTLHYPIPAYQALQSAASGLQAANIQEDGNTLNAIRHGEIQHHLFQALCRGTVRRTVNGRCGAMQAYVIASTHSGINEASLNSMFPKCRVEAWAMGDPLTRLKGKAKETYEAVSTWAEGAKVGDTLPFARVNTGHRGRFIKNVRKNLGFVAALESLGVQEYAVGQKRTRWIKYRAA